MLSMFKDIEERLESLNKAINSIEKELIDIDGFIRKKSSYLPVLRGIEPKTVQYDTYECDV